MAYAKLRVRFSNFIAYGNLNDRTDHAACICNA